MPVRRPKTDYAAVGHFWHHVRYANTLIMTVPRNLAVAAYDPTNRMSKDDLAQLYQGKYKKF